MQKQIEELIARLCASQAAHLANAEQAQSDYRRGLAHGHVDALEAAILELGLIVKYFGDAERAEPNYAGYDELSTGCLTA